MATDSRLEAYLSQLDRALGPIPVSERSEIITEIKSHILSAKEKDAQASLESLMHSLGEPESVANRYLIERGLKPGKPSKSPMIKWLVIGFLGTFALILLFGLVALWKFSPIFSIDEKADRVTVLGGLIDIDGKKGSVKIGPNIISGGGKGVDLNIDGAEGHIKITQKGLTGKISADFGDKFTLAGERMLPSTVTKVRGLFKNGRFRLQPSEDDHLSWTCSSKTKLTHDIEKSGSEFVLDLSKVPDSSCVLTAPKNLTIEVRGENGEIILENPANNTFAKLANGQVTLDLDKGEKFHFDLKVKQGVTDSFDDLKAAAGSKTAKEIKIEVGNGQILRP